jgi:hypothetical protein
MYKVQNQSIELSNVKTRNRLLDNYLDWVIYCMLPSSIGDVLFPKFTTFGLAYLPMEYAYLKFYTSQTIADTDTTMSYDVKSDALTVTDITEDIEDGKLLLVNYLFDFTAFEVHGIGLAFTGLGFGRDDVTVSDYLFSFVSLVPTDLRYMPGNGYAVVRSDKITTTETVIQGGYGYLPGYRYGQLQSIAMCYTDDGSDTGKEYLVEDLTFAVEDVGNVSVTGFDDFYYTDDFIYPTTDLYPATDLYPTQDSNQIKSVRFTYLGNDDDATVYKTYIAIKDLNVSYSGTDMSINLVCERG